MLFTKIMLSVMAAFAFVGIIDKLFFNNRFGYGSEFESGLCTLGPIVLSMAGFLCAAPVLQIWLKPLSACFSAVTGADPSIFSSTFLAIDMGGLPLALQTSSDLRMAAFSGGLYASMMGACISFMMPVALELLNPEDHLFLAKGMLYGICIIPVSCFLGGILMKLPLTVIIRNLFPVLFLSLLLIFSLIKAPGILLKAFQIFSKISLTLAHLFLFCSILQELTGYNLLPGMYTLSSQFATIGSISITLAGAYPFMRFLTHSLHALFSFLAQKAGMTSTCLHSMLICTCNCIPMLEKLGEMPPKDKICALAFMVPAAFTFGDHLAYLSAVIPDYLAPILIAKFAGGVIAFFFANYMETAFPSS